MAFQGGKRMKTGVQWLIGAGAIALLGIGGTLASMLWLSGSEAPVTVRLIPVARDTVEETINESGMVELGSQQTLKSPTEGAVDQVLIAPGEAIEAGQVLVVLRNAERQTATTDQQLKIEQQQEILRRSREKIAEAQAQLTAYREDMRRLSGLVTEGAIARTEIRNKEDEILRTEAELREAQAEANRAVLELERLDVENRKIQQQLQETVIAAPIDGIVLGVNVNDGDGVEVRTDLLTLGSPTQEVVRLQLSPLDAARVRVGQRARVSMIGPDPEVFTGRVVSVSPLAVPPDNPENARGSSQSSQAVVPTVIRLDQPTRSLIPGSQVNVEIVLESQENVVVLGTEAIQRTETEPFVWVLDNQGQAQKRPVKLGLEGLVTVQVVNGLRPGETVILPPPDMPLTSGMSVTGEEQQSHLR